ncbi:TPA: DNA adenine methylase [Raoultella terrigena]
MIKSPLKWAGGKTRVLPELLKHLPKACCLIEPFVGSGTVFMDTKREARRVKPGDTVII